jgi:hypothetical protein
MKNDDASEAVVRIITMQVQRMGLLTTPGSST